MAGKIGSFYVSGTDKIRPDLFSDFAEKIARSLAEIKENPKNPRQQLKNGVSPTQIRRMFDEVKRYERLLSEDNSDSWEKQYPYIKMMKSKVSYTVARAKKNHSKDAIYYDNLASFISEGIDLIKEQKDYHVFVSLFEAVYGFYYEVGVSLKD